MDAIYFGLKVTGLIFGLMAVFASLSGDKLPINRDLLFLIGCFTSSSCGYLLFH